MDNNIDESSLDPNILGSVSNIVSARRTKYGSPKKNFDNTALFWTAWLQGRGHNITFDSQDVAMMMTLVKISRLTETIDHADSIQDILGYVDCYNNCLIPEDGEFAKALEGLKI